MKATIYYKGLTVEIEGTPEEIAQYTDTLSKELNQPPDSTARGTIIWQIPMWYQYHDSYQNNMGGGGNKYINLVYDTCTPKWTSVLYTSLGASLL